MVGSSPEEKIKKTITVNQNISPHLFKILLSTTRVYSLSVNEDNHWAPCPSHLAVFSGPVVFPDTPACVSETRGSALLLCQQLPSSLQLTTFCGVWGRHTHTHARSHAQTHTHKHAVCLIAVWSVYFSNLMQSQEEKLFWIPKISLELQLFNLLNLDRNSMTGTIPRINIKNSISTHVFFLHFSLYVLILRTTSSTLYIYKKPRKLLFFGGGGGVVSHLCSWLNFALTSGLLCFRSTTNRTCFSTWPTVMRACTVPEGWPRDGENGRKRKSHEEFRTFVKLQTNVINFILFFLM